MKRRIRLLSVLLVLCMFMTSISIHPLEATKNSTNEHTFTKAELACMTGGSLGTATGSSGEFIEIKNIEGQEQDSRETTIYYIIEMAAGHMLTSPSSGTMSRTYYDNSGANDPRKWVFAKDNNGHYVVRSFTDTTKCLTVNPTTKAVTLSTYTGSEFQKWKMYYSSGGNALATTSTDSRISGHKLVINSTGCSLSNTTYTPVGFFDVSWYVPTASLSHPMIFLARDQGLYVTPTKTPSDATNGRKWTEWTTSNSSVMTVDTSGHIKGVSAGSATLVFMDKITKKFGMTLVTVMPISNGTYFLKNKETSNYAKVKSGTMTNGQNVVQYDFDGSQAERWIFTLNTSTGYFSIKSANSSSTNYYMAVSDDSSVLDKPIVIRSATESTLTDGMKWKVATTPNGAYKIIPKTGEATNYVLATSTSFGTNNANLLQGDYVDNNSYRDEWDCIRMLPTNGYELVYDSAAWAGEPSNNNNCYAYAINNQVCEPTGNLIWHKQQPGEYYNRHRGSSSAIPESYQYPPSIIVNSVVQDYNKYNSVNGTSVTFTPIDRYAVCPAGTYKVALVVSEDDYHWYRQDSDGLWSHKRGTTPVKRTDESGELIIDPMIAEKDEYRTFVGYYAVTPWNNMYNSSKSGESADIIVTSTTICDELLSEVKVGMTYENVIEMLQYEGIDVGSGTVIQQYQSNEGVLYTFNYLSVDGVFVVSNIRIGG